MIQILDKSSWIRVHEHWPNREVFADPRYVELFVNESAQAAAAFMGTPNGAILYPFVLRDIGDGLRDITSAYGYSGAFYHGDGAAHADVFWREFNTWATAERVVSEFVRFSLFPEQVLPYPGEREQKLMNIVRSLEPSEEELWMEFDHKVRKNVNKARRSGVTIEVDAEGRRLDDFIRIYNDTMDRRDARDSYYFRREFFSSIVQLSGQFVFIHALLADRVVSTELALVSADNVYSFLGGTDSDAFEARPNDLLKYELILWAKRSGKRRFVLGGGYAPDDGIYRYKRAFAPNGTAPFFVGKRILDRSTYAALVESHVRAGRAIDPIWTPDPGFFPAYRARLPDESNATS